MLSVKYLLSKKARNCIFVESGIFPEIEQFVVFDLSTASPEIRKKITSFPDTEIIGSNLLITVRSYVNSWIDSGFVLHGFLASVDAPITELSQVLVFVDQMESEMKERFLHELAEDTLKLEQAFSSRSMCSPVSFLLAKGLAFHLNVNVDLSNYNQLYEQYLVLLPELKQEKAEKEAARTAAKLAEEAECKAKAEAAAKAQSDWIAEFGSERLKLMSAGGFKGTLILYEAERAMRDFPNAILDLRHAATYYFNSSPSLHALKALKTFSNSFPDLSASLVILSKFPSAVVSEEEDEKDEESDEENTLSETWEALQFSSPLFSDLLYIILSSPLL